MPEKFPVTQATARVALQYIDAHDRTLWIKIGQALKSEFGDDGLHLFDEWSATATNYDGKAVKSTYKGFKANGGVGIGTLIHEAKARGFDPKAQASNAPASELTAEARAQAVAKRKEAEQREARATAKAHQSACNEAAALLAKSVDEATSPYLGIKQVGAHGVRFDVSPAGVDVLVPMCDGQGKVWGVQRIKPDGVKLFIKGGRKSGLWHMVGDVSGIEGVGADGAQRANNWLLVAEGYATAATLFQATGYPVAVAFDAGNLAPVCDALRALHPSVRLLVCADNDQATAQKTGKNTGVESARVASERVGGAVAIPDGLPLDKSDFNDLGLLQGLDAVKAQIEGAIRDASTVHTNAKTTPPTPTPKSEPHNATPQATQTDGVAVAGRGANGRFTGNSGAGFTCDDNGVWYQGFTAQGEPKKPLFICSLLRVIARTRDSGEGGGGFGLLLEFTREWMGVREVVEWIMPKSMLMGDGNAYRSRLMDIGVDIGTSAEQRKRLDEYLNSAVVDAYARSTDCIGWHGDAFVLPHKVIGAMGEERVVFQTDNIGVSPYKQSGTLEQWTEQVAQKCAGNSRPVFAISCAFAGVLLRMSGVERGGFGFHFVGDSSIGKSTMLHGACSVFGSQDYLKNWNTTSTAVEATSAQHSDTLLVLDEIGQVSDPRALGEMMYMLANGVGKARGYRTGGVRPPLSWRLVIVSSGEKTSADVMAEVGQKIKGGHEVRLVNIKADVSEGSVFERYPANESEAIAKKFKEVTNLCYGTAGIAFIEYVQARLDTLKKELRDGIERLKAEWIPHGAHSMVKRVANHFATVAVAGEMATQAGITGWVQGHAEDCAKICFDSWLDERGGAGNSEVNAMLSQLVGWFVANQEGRFKWWQRANDDHDAKVSNMAGYRRIMREGKDADLTYEKEDGQWVKDSAGCEVEYYVYPEVFRNDICKGFDYKVLARLLLDRGIIRADKGGLMKKARLPMSTGGTYMYVFNSTVFSALDG